MRSIQQVTMILQSQLNLKDDIIDDVQTQINSIINKETLIFLNHIEIIEIDTPDKRIIYKNTF